MSTANRPSPSTFRRHGVPTLSVLQRVFVALCILVLGYGLALIVNICEQLIQKSEIVSQMGQSSETNAPSQSRESVISMSYPQAAVPGKPVSSNLFIPISTSEPPSNGDSETVVSMERDTNQSVSVQLRTQILDFDPRSLQNDHTSPGPSAGVTMHTVSRLVLGDIPAPPSNSGISMPPDFPPTQLETMNNQTIIVYRTHRLVTGDTLEKLAEYYYQDRNKWPKIYQANAGLLTNKRTLPFGKDINIPPKNIP